VSGFFKPPPSPWPEQAEPRNSPLWTGRPHGPPLGAVVDELLLARSKQAAIYVDYVDAFPEGFELEIRASTSIAYPELARAGGESGPDPFGGHWPMVGERRDVLPPQPLRIGVRFADGRAATNIRGHDLVHRRPWGVREDDVAGAGVEVAQPPRLLRGLGGEQLDYRLFVPDRLHPVVRLRQLQGAVGSEARRDRVRNRVARRRPVVDPRHIGVGPEAPIASVSAHAVPVTEHRPRPFGAVKDQLTVDLLVRNRDLNGRPLTDQLDGTRRWQR
jgi:hypothetical protein